MQKAKRFAVRKMKNVFPSDVQRMRMTINGYQLMVVRKGNKIEVNQIHDSQ